MATNDCLFYFNDLVFSPIRLFFATRIAVTEAINLQLQNKRFKL